MSNNTAVAKVNPVELVRKTIFNDNFKQQIALALPKHVTPDRILRVALTATLNQPKIGEACQTAAGKASLYKAMLTASQLGLEPDGRQGHLVPFNDKRLGMQVQFIPGYQGLIGLAYNHPQVKAVWAEEVYEKDNFREVKGSERRLEHEPYDGDEDPGPLKAAYAVCEMDNGSKSWVVLRKRDIDRIKKSSRSASSEYSPWSTSPGAMWKKSAIRQLCKFIPQSNELLDALTKDDEVETVRQQEQESRFTASRAIISMPTQDEPGATAATTTESSAQTIEAEIVPETVNPDEAEEAAAGLAPTEPPTAPAATQTPAPPPAPSTVATDADTAVAAQLATAIKAMDVAQDKFCRWAKHTFRLSGEPKTIMDICESSPKILYRINKGLAAEFGPQIKAFKG